MALTDNLVSFWELEEASGTRNDSHGSNHLTDNNTVAQGSGKVGNCADFESGNSEYLSRADNAALSTGDIDFTVQAWVNLESKSATQAIVAKWDAAFEYVLYYDTAADRFKFAVYNGSVPTVTADNLGAVSISTWYLIHAWHDSVNNQVGIAVDAGTADTAAAASGPTDTTDAFTIGQNSGTQFFDGLIDQVGYRTRVVGSSDRTSLYNSGSGLSYAAMSGGGGGGGKPRGPSRSLLGVGR